MSEGALVERKMIAMVMDIQFYAVNRSSKLTTVIGNMQIVEIQSDATLAKLYKANVPPARRQIVK